MPRVTIEEILRKVRILYKSVNNAEKIVSDLLTYGDRSRKVTVPLTDFQKAIIQEVILEKGQKKVSKSLEERFQCTTKELIMERNKLIKKLHKMLLASLSISGGK